MTAPGAGLEIATIRGFVFLSVLLVASLLLSPGWFLAFLPQRYQLWVVRRWTDELFTRVTVLLTTLLVALCGWLVLSASRRYSETDRDGPGQDSRPMLLAKPFGAQIRQ